MILNFSLRRNSRLPAISIIAFLLAMEVAESGAVLAQNRIERGRKLFLHTWEPGDKLSPEGDGLGPMHNATSCAACHHLGGPGGAGTAEQNVSLLSALPVGKSPIHDAALIRLRAEKMHPGFGNGAGASILLHHLGTADEYEPWRLTQLGYKPPAKSDPDKARVTLKAFQRKVANRQPVAEVRRKQGCALILSHRNSTSLFGAGLIDAVPEEVLVAVARRQSRSHPGIHGRLPRTATGKVGRFGWRGQVETLHEFVVTACAMELGLQSDKHPQALNPLEPQKKLEGNDLTLEQCDALVAFVAALPAPRQLEPNDPEQANLVHHGERVFETIGCAACHVRDLGSVEGLFSDLLLHDLGPGLEDPVPAFPDPRQSGSIASNVSGSGGGVGYGGGTFGSAKNQPIGSTQGSAVRREWKTPPLWGLRDSAPYLHDGRARTLTAAIAAHGGEAESSANRFAALDELARASLLKFLNSLAGPPLPQ